MTIFGLLVGGATRGGLQGGVEIGSHSKNVNISLEVSQKWCFGVVFGGPKSSVPGALVFFWVDFWLSKTSLPGARAFFSDMCWWSRDASQRTGIARDAFQDIKKTCFSNMELQYLTRRVQKVIFECSRNCLKMIIFRASGDANGRTVIGVS